MSLFQEFAIEGQGGGQLYPALQALDYKPKKGQFIPFVLSEESAELLSDEAKTKLNLKPVTAYYSNTGEESLVYEMGDFRVVALGFPRLCYFDKKAQKDKYGFVTEGLKFVGSSRVTALRMLFAVVVNGEILLSDVGTVQLFTLKLTSTKTKLCGGDINDKDFVSFKGINADLVAREKLKPRSEVVHLVSVKLKIEAEVFTSRQTGESSVGVIFKIDGDYQPLTKEQMALMNALRLTEEVVGFLKDPFRINASKEAKGEPESTPPDNDTAIAYQKFVDAFWAKPDSEKENFAQRCLERAESQGKDELYCLIRDFIAVQAFGGVAEEIPF